MTRRVDSVLDLIGETPVVRLHRAISPEMATIWAKLEHLNPGGSVKDRMAVATLLEAERRGDASPGRTTVIEATAGNSGVALAMVCAARGYRLILTMPEDVSRERVSLLRAYGAECLLTPAALGQAGAQAEARRLAAHADASFHPDVFVNPQNPAAHAAGTAQELVSAFADIGLDGFVVGVGTGGTVTGVAPVLRLWWPDIVICAVEPSGSAVLSGGAPGPHAIQGLGAGFVPELLRGDAYDELTAVSDDAAFDGARALARAEGLLVGISSGACFVAARRLARRLGPGRNVCFIVASGGERYLSAGLFP